MLNPNSYHHSQRPMGYLYKLIGIYKLVLWKLLNPYLEPWNLLFLEPLLGTSEPSGTFTWNCYWNPHLEHLGTLEPWNPGTFRNLYLEPLLGTYLEPRNLPEPYGMTAPECPRTIVWLRPQSFQLLGKKKSNWAVFPWFSNRKGHPILMPSRWTTLCQLSFW